MIGTENLSHLSQCKSQFGEQEQIINHIDLGSYTTGPPTSLGWLKDETDCMLNKYNFYKLKI